MGRKEEYILMYKNEEVLSFCVTFSKRNNVEIIKPLAHFDKAPYGIKKDASKEQNDLVLFRFFNARSIPPQRWDYQNIIKATKCKDDFELSFKGHGLSLSNHYWFKKEGEDLKYEDINFFTNKWDDSFAKAVLNEDYESLKTVDLNVPDIVTSGWGVKGWLYEEDGPKLYKLGIAKDHYEECLAEVLASKIAARLFGKGKVVDYELRKIDDKYASVSSSIINVDEELIPLSDYLPRDLYALYRNYSNDRKMSEEFFKRIAELGYPELFEFFVKISCLKSLCFVSDLHFQNLSMIRNMKTGKLRLAPLFDLGGAFGSTESGRKFLSNLNTGSYLIVYFIYGNLNPNWDYSWYDPNSLDGVEEEIRNTLSLSDFYTPELIDNIIGVYRYQKATLDNLAKGKNK